ncbi:unannotated protein [freshwater metagenome]|uniref:Unannotated protein n=1 Tax=freshwater metagenome TaxID=449393 RepID=A0A6J7HCQ0_9ZZZZ
MGEEHVRRRRDGEVPLDLRGEVDRVELAALAQRCAAALGPPDGLLLVAQVLPVPDLDQHPDLAADQVGAAVHPGVGARDPDEAVQGGRLLGLEVVGAVLEAEQVARGHLVRGRRRRPAEPQLRPADADQADPDPGQVADGVHGHLRVVGAGLDAQVPAADRRVDQVAGEAGQLDQRRGLPVGDAEPVRPVGGAEQGGPEPDGQRQPGRRQTQRLAGVVRRRVLVAPHRTDRAGVLPPGHPPGGRRPVLQQADEGVPVVGDDVEGDEVQPVLGGGHDAGLVVAVELHGVLTGCGGGRLRLAAGRPAARAQGDGTGGADTGGPEEVASGELHDPTVPSRPALRPDPACQPATTAGTWLTCAASALSESDRPWTCSGVSAV